MAMQGDSYLIPIVVRQNDVVIEPQMVELLVLKIGGIAKFLKLPDRPVETGGRMKLPHQEVVGFRGPDVNVRKAIVEGVI